jgi:GT2 family glycosyltransferase
VRGARQLLHRCDADVIANALRQSPYLRTIWHGVNVGCGANCLRCFEVAPTGWIWLLSDDDSPRSDAFENIAQEIARHPDACYINFATRILDNRQILRSTTTGTIGMTEFIEAIDSLINLLFITAGVQNLALTHDQLPWTYRDIATHGCQVEIILRTLA